MERHEILEMMTTLQLSGMRAAYDEIVQTGVKRQHSFERILGALAGSQRRIAIKMEIGVRVFFRSRTPQRGDPLFRNGTLRWPNRVAKEGG